MLATAQLCCPKSKYKQSIRRQVSGIQTKEVLYLFIIYLFFRDKLFIFYFSWGFLCLSVAGSFALSHAALCLSTMLLVAASADISDINQLLKSSFRDDDDIRKYRLREFFFIIPRYVSPYHAVLTSCIAKTFESICVIHLFINKSYICLLSFCFFLLPWLQEVIQRVSGHSKQFGVRPSS